MLASYLRRHHVALAALFFALGGTAYAALGGIPDSHGVIHACFKTTNGALRVVRAGSECRTGERGVGWNQQGHLEKPVSPAHPVSRAHRDGPGQPGPPGPFPGVLPRGITVRGNWAGGSSAAGTAYESISFGFAFASAPTFNYVPGPIGTRRLRGRHERQPDGPAGQPLPVFERLRVEHARRRGHRPPRLGRPVYGELHQRALRRRRDLGRDFAADDRVSGAGFVEAVEKAQASAPAGSTKRSGVRDSAPPPTPSREPCRPLLGPAETVVSGCPAWARIHAITAAKSAPSARIAARSITSPPER